MPDLVLRSPAKINLFLRVLERREDGFHNLASLLQAVDLFDTLSFTLTKTDSLACRNAPCDPSNFVWKAVQLFRKRTGCTFGVQIHITKKIPCETGLGGGSGNVATTLFALNQLLGAQIAKQQLLDWSGEISSDAPFFFSQGTALIGSRGEVVQSRAPLHLPPLYLVKPPGGLSTPAVFKALKLESCSRICAEDLLQRIMEGRGGFHNDLERPALQLNPALADLKRALQRACAQVWMTGSGVGWITTEPQKEVEGVKFYPLHPVYRQGEGWY